jgi:hypothetical protein
MVTYAEVRGMLKHVMATSIGPSDEWLVKQCLLHNMSYRLPKQASVDPMIGVREWRRWWRRRSSDRAYEGDGCNRDLLLLSNKSQLEGASDYVKACIGHKPGFVLLKDDLFGSMKSGEQMQHLLFSLGIVLRCFFSDHRSNLALLIREVPEWISVLRFSKQQGIKKVYNFIPFEKDTNFLSMLFRDAGIEHVLIPSAGPLATHNHMLLGTELIISTPYHKEELLHFRETIRVGKITRWIPERSQQYVHRYLSTRPTPAKTIGFYSHGSWLRSRQSHADNGLGIEHAEERLMADLSRFLKAHPDFRLVIFAHPREKKPEVLEQSMAYYGKYFSMDNGSVTFTGPEVKTALAFDMVDIAVAAFSTIQYERLFCKFKMLIGNYGIEGFPLRGSSLARICFRRYEDMEALLLKSTALSADAFFAEFGLEDYSFQAPDVTLPAS